MNHRCFNCGKDSGYDIDHSIGATAAHLSEEGWRMKSGLLFTGNADLMLFCSDKCTKDGMQKYFSENNVSQEKINETRKFLDELRKEKPETIDDTWEKTNKLLELLKKIKKDWQ